MTLLMFVATSRRDRLSATTIIVSHLVLEPPELEVDEWLKGPSTSSEELYPGVRLSCSLALGILPPETETLLL